MALAAFQSVSAGRDELLWEEELARVRAGHHLLSPAAAAAVQSVLSSILDEPAQNEEDLLSVLALVQEIRSETVHPITAPKHAALLRRLRPAWP